MGLFCHSSRVSGCTIARISSLKTQMQPVMQTMKTMIPEIRPSHKCRKSLIFRNCDFLSGRLAEFWEEDLNDLIKSDLNGGPVVCRCQQI